MSNERNRSHHEARAALDECFDQFRFARATELARSGRYLEAEGILSPNGHPSETPRDLDLLARIAVQQGRASDARRLWEHALEEDPKNSAYKECLQRLGDLPRLIISFDTILTCLIWTTNISGAAALLYTLLSHK